MRLECVNCMIATDRNADVKHHSHDGSWSVIFKNMVLLFLNRGSCCCLWFSLTLGMRHTTNNSESVYTMCADFSCIYINSSICIQRRYHVLLSIDSRILVAISDIQFGDKTEIIQEFVEDLYMLDGYRFDIGVYVAITSINPIRAYIYNEWRVK